jgi:hypothetical protein
VLVHWGLVPFWTKDVKVGDKMINARAETVHEKLVFRQVERPSARASRTTGIRNDPRRPNGACSVHHFSGSICLNEERPEQELYGCIGG